MMSRFLRVKLVRRLKSFSGLRKRIPVSYTQNRSGESKLMYSDVIVLTSMGEEVAIEAKEAPAKG